VKKTDLYLKPGTYIKSSTTQGDVQGISLENFVVSVLNNPTCCPKPPGSPDGMLMTALTLYPTLQTVTDFLGNSSAIQLSTLRLGIRSDSSVTTQTSSVIQSSTSNANLVIAPNGTGALIANIPDGLVAGGNARGANAVDLQTIRTSNYNVAGGNYSVITGGTGNTASGVGSAVLGGMFNGSSGGAAMSFGESSSASGGRSIAGGYQAISSANYAVCFGNTNTASSQNSTVSGGQSNTASTGTHATVVGGSVNAATGSAATVLGGNQNTSSGIKSIAGGDSSNASGSWAVSIGYANTSSNSGTVAMGVQNSASGYGAVAFGSSSQATGGRSLAVGDTCVASGGNSMALGSQNIASGNFSTTISTYAIASLYNQFAQGTRFGVFGNQGQCQISTLIASAQASLGSAATTVLSLDGTGVTNLIIPNGNNRAWNVQVDWVAVVTTITGTATGISVGDVITSIDLLAFKRVGGISSASAHTSTATKLMVTTPAAYAACAINYTAGASQEMALTFTAPTFVGGGSVTMRVVARIELSEVAWG
jgi:hypothetical protein